MNKVFRLTIITIAVLSVIAVLNELTKGVRAQPRLVSIDFASEKTVRENSQDSSVYELIVKPDKLSNDEITVKITLRNKGAKLFYIYERTLPKDL